MSGKHEVVLSASAERDLARLPDRTGDEVRRFITGPLRNDPRKAGSPLPGEQVAMFEASGPGWRVLYRVDANTRSVRVMLVAHRPRSASRAS